MLLLALILLPAAAAALAYFVGESARGRILIGAAVLHLALVMRLWTAPGYTALSGWLVDDALGRVILTLVSILFLAIAHYAVGYLRDETARGGRAFASCLLGFLAAASLVTLSHHFALLWIGLETTTLSVAPLIYHRHDRRSLEAVWKYLMLSSVGIALALLGIFLLATAQPSGANGGQPLVLDDLMAHAAALDPVGLRAAFVFMLIGFGTKMGLAPLHSWKPDTYGEAPCLVGGLQLPGPPSKSRPQPPCSCIRRSPSSACACGSRRGPRSRRSPAAGTCARAPRRSARPGRGSCSSTSPRTSRLRM